MAEADPQISAADLNQVKINVSGPEAQATLVRNVISRTLADLGAKMSGDVHPEAVEPLELVDAVPETPAWGPPIEVDRRPAWLADSDLISIRLPYTKKRMAIPAGDEQVCWNTPGALILKADHWAYPVLAKGFTPWAGGPEAPADWDGGDVLLRNGNTTQIKVPDDCGWQRGLGGFPELCAHLDIIGYRKRDTKVHRAAVEAGYAPLPEYVSTMSPQPIGSATITDDGGQDAVRSATVEPRQRQIDLILAVIKSERETIRRLLAS